MKDLKQAELMVALTRGTVIIVGALFVFVCALAGYQYIRGELTKEVVINITTMVSQPIIAYSVIAFLVMWVISEGILFVLRVRDWWIHRKERKEELKQDLIMSGENVKQLWRRVTGVVE